MVLSTEPAIVTDEKKVLRPACACLALVAPNPVLFALAQKVYETRCTECPSLFEPSEQ